MKVALNHTHRFTKQLDDVPQDAIAACATFDGVSVAEALSSRAIPREIQEAIAALPYQREPRAHCWLYIRPQLCRRAEPDRRSGSFWHIDVDAVFRAVAPDWDDFRAMAVSFGNVAETEFIDEPMEIDVLGPPRSEDYVTFAGVFNDGRQRKTHAAAPCQVAEYTIRDVHRAGPVRRDGWRLIVLAFETNAPPVENWPPPPAPRY